MTIETSPAAVSPHKTARADSQGGKAKSAETDPQGGGFMAILGALGDAPAAVTTDAPATDAATAQTTAPDSTTPQNSFVDAATLLQQNPQIAAAQTQLAAAPATTTSAAVAAASMAAIATVTATAASLATATSAASAMSSVTTDAPADGSTLLAKPDPSTLQFSQPLQPLQPSMPGDASQVPDASTRRPGPAPIQASTGNAATATAEQAQLQTSGESATQGLQHAAGHAKSAKDSQLAAADTALASSTTATSSEKSEAPKWMAALDQSKAPPATKAMEPVFAPLLVKAEKSTGERAAFAFKNAEPGYSGTAFGVSAPDHSQSGAAAPITSPEMQVAEQVTYWVSQNVQNAELKLDGLGQSPVEVSISVQGKEAQITFRTDEAATRGVLEGASAHLKDMLQREGMVLTGVSVGTSGSGDSSGAERRARQAARQGVIAPLQVTTAPAQDIGRRVGSVAGRSIDLFV